MSRRPHLLLLAALVAAVLFGGRWIAEVLTDRWWAAGISDAAARFITDRHLLRATLDLGGALVSTTWFAGHFLLVARAIASVQITSRGRDGEARERVAPRQLVLTAVAAGAVLGLLVGTGPAGWWPAVALAWRGLSLGVVDPVLGHDAGLYVAQLPLWRLLHGYALLHAILGLAAVLTLYAVIGAVRWSGRQAAINQHARQHLGWLLAAIAAVVAWGYLLEPYEAVAGIGEVPTPTTTEIAVRVVPFLTTGALLALAASIAWAFRPRHALLLGGWGVLAVSSIVCHYIVPGAAATGPTSFSAETVRALDRVAFGLANLAESLRATGAEVPPETPPGVGLWNARAIDEATGGDSSRVLAAALVDAGGAPSLRPGWLVLRGLPGGPARALTVADDRAAPTGGPLYWAADELFPAPVAVPRLTLSAHAVRPDAPVHDIHADARGVLAGDLVRRFLLAWSLQAGSLLGDVAPGTRVAWYLTPAERLAQLAPFAEWGVPAPRLIDGRLVWVADGFVGAEHFPIVGRLPWRDRQRGMVRVGFVGVIDAETGATRIFRREEGGPLAAAWESLAEGVIEPPERMPPVLAARLAYPAELFLVQARALERAPWSIGTLAGRADSGRGEPHLPDPLWQEGASAPGLIIAYQPMGERQISAVLLGRMRNGRPALELARVDSAASLPVPAVLEHRWSRFPTYDQLRDSVLESGAQLQPGPVRLWMTDGGLLGAHQVHYGQRPGSLTAAWVAVAAQQRLGGARTPAAAWENLLGYSAPLPPTRPTRANPLDEVRQLVEAADAALRNGDLAAFGRHFEALRALTGAGRPRREP